MGFTLRVPTEEDAYVWHELFDDPEVMEFHGGRAHSVAVYEELTARQRAHDATLGYCLWTVLSPSGVPVGFVGAQPWQPQDWGPVGEIEIGWRLGREHWGQGYATRCAQETLRRLKEMGVPRAVAMVAEGNHRSAAVAERLEMRHVESFTIPHRGTRGRRYELALA
ncbi:GNAT family N-acetyltransferase [Streptomyces sp. XM4193]|nr:GNAT family N-acetyltransferase [Streptomyces sp. XM4193]MCK1796620.1 GNAT family N-acetyltransferase [Streptomyces sp. XM4193]